MPHVELEVPTLPEHLSPTSNILFGLVHSCYSILTFLVPCCDVHLDFRVKTMFGSSLPPNFFSYFVYVICIHLRILVSNMISISDDVRVITVTRRVSHAEQELLTLPELMSSSLNLAEFVLIDL